jgi:uncharacterized protein YeaO (DUF488 family)
LIKLKRAYEPPSDDDGKRVLVERLWPRGVSKAEAKIDEWFKDVAPSAELRKWYAHDVEKWPEFKRRYTEELKQNKGEVDEIKKMARGSVVTFIYAAHDTEHNSAVVLKEFVQDRKK